MTYYLPAPSPTLEAVPGRPRDLSNSKLAKVSVSADLMGLMGMSASMFCGSVRVRVGSAMASGTRRTRVRVASQGDASCWRETRRDIIILAVAVVVVPS
jgi:hypothetical protein